MHPRLKAAADAVLAWLAGAVFAGLRGLGLRRASALGGAVLSALGPFTPRHKRVMANLALAFPQRDAAWHRAVARDAWENLGRTACEYVHLAELAASAEMSPESQAALARLRADPRPKLAMAAHLANWEVPAVIMHAAGERSGIIYRTPNNARIAEMVRAMREPIMGRLIPATLAAPRSIHAMLRDGVGIGMLIDQHFSRGMRVEFMGTDVLANPLLAHLAARYGIAVYGMRAVRLPGGGLRAVLEGPYDLPADIPGAVQAMNDIIARWVREHPGDWLWMHRRWRDLPARPDPAPQA
jgi:KDO2-lipid IV(A) lauroyltransferase